MNRSILTVAGVTAAGIALGLAGAGCERAAQRDPPGASEQQGSTRTTSAKAGADQAQGARGMKNAKGFVQNIENLTTDNHDFRRVLYTAKNVQLVVMAIPPGDHIGAEVHDVDQFFRVEEGKGEVVIDQVRTPLEAGSAIVVPAGAKHDIVNTGAAPLQLYTLYAPPHHRDGVVHRTRAEAEKDTEHFDGKTTQ